MSVSWGEGPVTVVVYQFRAYTPPVRNERSVLVCGVVPGKLPHIDDVELGLGQPLIDKLAVDRWRRAVSAAGNDFGCRFTIDAAPVVGAAEAAAAR